jgi:hypothetical protein
MFDQDAMDEILAELQKGGWSGDLDALRALFRRATSGGGIRLFRTLLAAKKTEAALPDIWQQAMDRFEGYVAQYEQARMDSSIYPTPQITFTSPRQKGLPKTVALDMEDNTTSAFNGVWGHAGLRIRFFTNQGYQGDENLIWTPRRKD